MTRSELIDKIASKHNHLPYGEVEASVKTLLEQMSEALTCGERIEIRGFGSFSVRVRGFCQLTRRIAKCGWIRIPFHEDWTHVTSCHTENERF